MSKTLWIAGHGLNKNNGHFDSGATGFITKGEHKYFRDDVFPKLKEYIHKDDLKDSVFHTEYNVYSHNNIVSLAKGLGSDTRVIECHFDAVSNTNARGGHVIIYSGFTPDKLDLAIRDVISKNIGLAYPVHKGHKGISGRSDLRNVIACANGGVNYRLIELGFGTNKQDAGIMTNNLDQIAKDLIMATYGRVKDNPAGDPAGTQYYRVQVGAYLDKRNAEFKAQALKSKGEDVYIVKY